MGDVGLAQGEGAPAAADLTEAVAGTMDSAVATVVLDASGRVVTTSERWRRLSGWAAGEVKGRQWSELFVPGGGAPVGSGRLRTAEGGSLAVLCTTTPLRGGASGERLLVVSELGSLAGQVALGPVRSLLAGLIDEVGLGVLVIGEDGTVATVNASFLRELGAVDPPETFLGRPIAEARRRFNRKWADPESGRRILDEIVRRREPVTDAHFEMADGHTLAVSFAPVGEVAGRGNGQMWLLRDITTSLEAAAEREYLLAIEKEQNARLKELDTMKSQLVASVSHELRTPLTSIVSFTGLLREGLGADPVEDQEEFLDIIGRNTERLIRLVDDLLFLDKLDSNLMPLEFEAVNLPQLVTQAVASIRPRAESQGLEMAVETAPGPPLLGDPQRLGQLVDNLLANAVKFTPEGGRVSVRVTPQRDGWSLEVADTGIGVPDDEQSEIFERFFRASNARRQAMAGSGLGLAIVKRIVQAHGGGIEITSGEGEGTTCAVTLPGAARPVPTSSPAGRGGATS
ncbi:MAG: ATP-binding protein [Acidimicrobiales bacterium]